jgi:hypothetical protein
MFWIRFVLTGNICKNIFGRNWRQTSANNKFIGYWKYLSWTSVIILFVCECYSPLLHSVFWPISLPLLYSIHSYRLWGDSDIHTLESASKNEQSCSFPWSHRFSELQKVFLWHPNSWAAVYDLHSSLHVFSVFKSTSLTT